MRGKYPAVQNPSPVFWTVGPRFRSLRLRSMIVRRRRLFIEVYWFQVLKKVADWLQRVCDQQQSAAVLVSGQVGGVVFK